MLHSFRSFLPVFALALPLAACGSDVSSTSSGGTGGAGAAGGTTSSDTTTSDTGPTTTTTTEMGTTTPSTPVCDGGFSVHVVAAEPSGTKHSCADNPMNETIEVDGVVTSVVDGVVSVDMCAPNTQCDPSVWTFTTVADPLVLSIPTGTFVHATIAVWSDMLSGCTGWLALENLATWNGVANPTTDRPLVWLTATEMSYGPASSIGGEIGLEAIDVPECVGTPEAGQSLYKYRFYDALDEANEVIVEIGQVGELQVSRDGSSEVWRFGNGIAGCLGASCQEGGVFSHFLTQAPTN